MGQGRPKPSVAAVVVVSALVLATGGLAILQWRAARSVIDIGFWFEVPVVDLPADTTRALGGPLTPEERQTIARLSRRELEDVFAGFRVRVTDDPSAFWRVVVLHQAQPRPRVYPPGLQSAGETMSFGPLGGAGSVDFTVVATNAVRLAPPGTSRDAMVAAIGRGIGRVAAHEVAHQIIGPEPGAHNEADEYSYEYPNPDRASQYYGKMRWTTALPVLRRKLGLSSAATTPVSTGQPTALAPPAAAVR